MRSPASHCKILAQFPHVTLTLITNLVFKFLYAYHHRVVVYPSQLLCKIEVLRLIYYREADKWAWGKSRKSRARPVELILCRYCKDWRSWIRNDGRFERRLCAERMKDGKACESYPVSSSILLDHFGWKNKVVLMKMYWYRKWYKKV